MQMIDSLPSFSRKLHSIFTSLADFDWCALGLFKMEYPLVPRQAVTLRPGASFLYFSSFSQLVLPLQKMAIVRNVIKIFEFIHLNNSHPLQVIVLGQPRAFWHCTLELFPVPVCKWHPSDGLPSLSSQHTDSRDSCGPAECSGPGHQKSWSSKPRASNPSAVNVSVVPPAPPATSPLVSIFLLLQKHRCPRYTRHHAHRFTDTNSSYLYSNSMREVHSQPLHLAQKEAQEQRGVGHTAGRAAIRGHVLWSRLTPPPDYSQWPGLACWCSSVAITTHVYFVLSR